MTEALYFAPDFASWRLRVRMPCSRLRHLHAADALLLMTELHQQRIVIDFDGRHGYGVALTNAARDAHLVGHAHRQETSGIFRRFNLAVDRVPADAIEHVAGAQIA